MGKLTKARAVGKGWVVKGKKKPAFEAGFGRIDMRVHSCPKTVGLWGSLFKFATHRTTLLLTAPISATNGIEDRHKKGSVLIEP